MFNSFNAISENSKRVSYYGFYQHRTANGWRDNSQYNIYTGYISANFQITKDIILNTEYTRSDYKSQQPGGLTDVQYNVNHRQSSRERNWFGAPFNIVSITLIYSISRNINVQLKSFITIAERNSVGYTKAINIKDSINSTTLQYNSRQVDRDQYHNYGSEMRMSVKYNFFKNESILAGGMRIYSAQYLSKLSILCKELNILLIADEIATGFGRTGEMFACQHAEIVPDIMVLGKGLTSGFIPMSAVAVIPKIYSSFRNLEDSPIKNRTFFHGHTYSGHPLAAACARATLKAFKEEDIIERMQPQAEQLSNIFAEIAADLPGSKSNALGMISMLEIPEELGGKQRAARAALLSAPGPY